MTEKIMIGLVAVSVIAACVAVYFAARVVLGG